MEYKQAAWIVEVNLCSKIRIADERVDLITGVTGGRISVACHANSCHQVFEAGSLKGADDLT